MHKISEELLSKNMLNLILTEWNLMLIIIISSSDWIEEKMNQAKGGNYMTEMRRVTISIPNELDKKVLELKKDDRFIRCSYSEIVRMLLQAGLEAEDKKEAV